MRRLWLPDKQGNQEPLVPALLRYPKVAETQEETNMTEVEVYQPKKWGRKSNVQVSQSRLTRGKPRDKYGRKKPVCCHVSMNALYTYMRGQLVRIGYYCVRCGSIVTDRKR